MKFVLSKGYRYWWPIRIDLPDPERAGEMLACEIRIEFEPEDQDALLAAGEAYGTSMSAREIVEHERARLLAVVKDWADVVDDAGAAVPFGRETFLAALGQSWFRLGVLRAYAESLGGEAARRGN